MAGATRATPAIKPVASRSNSITRLLSGRCTFRPGTSRTKSSVRLPSLSLPPSVAPSLQCEGITVAAPSKAFTA